MSAAQSNLSAPQYGYDFVVATTQASINSTMKWFLDGLTEPVVTVCYLEGDNNALVPISYQDLLAQAHGSDPFKVSATADPATDKDLKNLYDAGFYYGFRARLGLPPVTDPATLPPVVELGLSASGVTFNMLCAEFDVVYLDPGTGRHPQILWTNLSQQPDHPWVFQSKVDLRLDDVLGTAFHTLPDAVKAQIKNLSGTAFSIQQLLFDLSNAALETIPQITGVSAGDPVYTLLLKEFTGAYFDQMRTNGEPLLGCAIVQQTPSNSTLQLTDMNIEVSPFTGADGRPLPSPTAQQLDLTTLGYLCASGGHPLPPAVPFTWNWIDPAEQADGVVAINRKAFTDLIKQQMLPSVTANCYAPTVKVTLDSASEPVYSIHVTPDQSPSSIDETPHAITNPGSLGLPASATSYLQVLRFSYDGESDDQAGLDGDIGKARLNTHYDATVYFSGNVITVAQNLIFKLMIEKNLSSTSGTPIKIARVDTCTIDVDQSGQLTATMATPVPAVNNASGGDVNSFINFFTHLGSEFSSAAAYLQRITGAMLNTLPFTAAQYFVFPGGQTFAYKDALFSATGDLTSRISYASPDQQPPADVLPVGEVARGDHLTAGQWLASGNGLHSQNGNYAVVLQGDGNLVLCHAVAGVPDLNRPFWSAHGNLPANYTAQPQGTQFYAALNADGNLVLGDGNGPLAGGQQYWSVKSGQPVLGQFTAVMQDDGNFVIYHGMPGSFGTAVFATGTSGIGA